MLSSKTYVILKNGLFMIGIISDVPDLNTAIQEVKDEIVAHNKKVVETSKGTMKNLSDYYLVEMFKLTE